MPWIEFILVLVVEILWGFTLYFLPKSYSKDFPLKPSLDLENWKKQQLMVASKGYERIPVNSDEKQSEIYFARRQISEYLQVESTTPSLSKRYGLP